MNILQFSFWCAAKWMDKRCRCFPIMVIWNIVQWWRIQWSFYLWRSCWSIEGINKLMLFGFFFFRWWVLRGQKLPVKRFCFTFRDLNIFHILNFVVVRAWCRHRALFCHFSYYRLFHWFVLLLTSSLWKKLFYSSTR